MYTHILTVLSGFRRNVRTVVLAGTCIVSAFAVGIESAGEVQPISLIEAGSTETAGDVTGDGRVDLQDVTLILEIAQGYVDNEERFLKADPNRDGQITVDDALRLLATISLK
jgi:hypothetical protein